MKFRTLQTQILPAGGRDSPARPRDQPIFPLYPRAAAAASACSACIRIRMAGSLSAQSNANSAAKSPARLLRRLCLSPLCVVAFAGCMVRLLSRVRAFARPNRCFKPSYQNFPAFSSGIAPESMRFLRLLPQSAWIFAPVPFIMKQTVPSALVGNPRIRLSRTAHSEFKLRYTFHSLSFRSLHLCCNLRLVKR